MGSPLVEHVALWLPTSSHSGLAAAIGGSVRPAGGPVLDRRDRHPGGRRLRTGRFALHRQQPGRDRGKTLVRERIGPRRTDHRARWRGGFSGGSAARWVAFRTIGGGSFASTRCPWSRCRKARSATFTPATARRCRPARRWARSFRATTFKTPGASWGARRQAPSTSRFWVSAAASGRSCVKVFTRSTSPFTRS